MLKRKITFYDLDGVEKTKTFYFNLTKSELLKMEYGTTGGLINMVKRVYDEKDTPAVLALFETLLMKSYGEKSDDGMRFIKSEELSIAFSQTDAYDQLYMELVTDADAAINFILGIVPAEMSKQANEMQLKGKSPEEIMKLIEDGNTAVK